MPVPFATTANANSAANLATLQMAAFDEFMFYATDAIENAELQGKKFVVLTTFQYCNIENIQTFFISLGYAISYPDEINPDNPLYEPYEDYGVNGIPLPRLINPVRMKLDWTIVQPNGNSYP